MMGLEFIRTGGWEFRFKVRSETTTGIFLYIAGGLAVNIPGVNVTAPAAGRHPKNPAPAKKDATKKVFMTMPHPDFHGYYIQI
jgi:hypothetical protein